MPVRRKFLTPPNNSSASRFRSVKDPKVTDSKLKELASSEATQRWRLRRDRRGNTCCRQGGRTTALWWRCSGSCFRKHPCSRPNARALWYHWRKFQFFSGFSKLSAATRSSGGPGRSTASERAWRETRTHSGRRSPRDRAFHRAIARGGQTECARYRSSPLRARTPVGCRG